MSFEVFPYTNFHELNLDWIIDSVRKLQDQMNDLDPAEVQTMLSEIETELTSFGTEINSLTTQLNQFKQIYENDGVYRMLPLNAYEGQELAEEYGGLSSHIYFNTCVQLRRTDWNDLPASMAITGVFLNFNYGVSNITDKGAWINFLYSNSTLFIRTVRRNANDDYITSGWSAITTP